MSWHQNDIPGASATVSTFVPDDRSDVVLFNSATNQLHRLPGAAASVWAALDGTRSVTEVVALVAELHQARTVDIKAIFDQFEILGLIESVRVEGV